MSGDGRILHVEVQRFTQPWLVLLVGAVAAFTWIVAIAQLIFGQPVGTNPASDAGMVAIWVLVGVALPALFLLANLRTEVREHAICIRFTPFHLRYRCFRYADIRSIRARRYRPLREYGGWGLRLGPSGWAYNVSGDLGVQLELVDGRRVLIGSRDPEAIVAAVKAAGGPVIDDDPRT